MRSSNRCVWLELRLRATVWSSAMVHDEHAENAMYSALLRSSNHRMLGKRERELWRMSRLVFHRGAGGADAVSSQLSELVRSVTILAKRPWETVCQRLRGLIRLHRVFRWFCNATKASRAVTTEL